MAKELLSQELTSCVEQLREALHMTVCDDCEDNDGCSTDGAWDCVDCYQWGRHDDIDRACDVVRAFVRMV